MNPPRPDREGEQTAGRPDTEPEQALGDLASLAAQICGTAGALIVTSGAEGLRIRAQVGLRWREAARAVSLIAQYSTGTESWIVPDVTRDERFARDLQDPPETRIRFLAVAPLIPGEEPVSGALGVIDQVPRTLDAAQQRGLQILARQVAAQLEWSRRINVSREREAQLRLALDAAQMGTFTWDVATNRIALSPDLAPAWNCPPGAFEGTFEALARRVPPEDVAAIKADVAHCALTRDRFVRTFRVTWPDGRLHWLEAHGEVRANETGEARTLHGVIFDATAHQNAELRVQHLNRVYAVLTAINQTILRRHDSATLLATACRIAVEQGSFLMAWIGLVGAEGRLEVAAHAGADETTSEELRRIVSGLRPDSALTYQALQTGNTSVCNDIARDPRASSWRGAALARGYRSMASMPLPSGNATLGTLNLYAGETDFFDADELRLLEQLAHDIAFGLDVSRREEERRQTDERLARQRSALISLTGERGSSEEDLPTALRRITAMAARTLAVARTSFWRFNGDRSALECSHLFTADVDHHTAGGVLEAAAYPIYVHAVAAGEIVALDDTHRDPRLQKFTREHLEPLGVRAVLSVPVNLAGTSIGALAHEHIGAERTWTADEKTFAVAMANLVSLALESADRRQAEAALRESEASFRELAETILEVFWVYDATQQRVLYVSPAYERVWGRGRADLYTDPESWFGTVHADDRDRVRRAVATQLPRGTYDETYRIVRPDGTVRWIRARAFHLHDATGNLRRTVGTAEDITERRQLEEQFREAQKLESLGQLAGGVAHDFNNLLTVIQGYASLLMISPQGDAESHEAAEQIVQATERAATLTRQLLAFSRRQVIHPRELNLNEIVVSLARMLQRIVGEDVSLQINLHPRPLWTRADAGMLDQVLLNLVVNARDAMPQGGRLILETGETKVEAGNVAPGRYVCVRVSDTGIGIAPEHLPRIFDPFFSTKDPGKGTGLGLATVFGIVKQHGGTIEVDSTPGVGTTFRVLLPAADRTSAPRPATAPEPEPPGGTETILLVEDDRAVRALTRTVLERAGYRVIEAAHGREALERHAEHQGRINLLFTDIVMPEGLSGRELAARLQSRQPDQRVIFTSGYSTEIAGRELALQPGRNFIQKPASLSDLLKTVRRCLDA